MLSGAKTRDFLLREPDEAEYLAACERLQNHVAIHMLDMAFRPEDIHQLSWQQIHGDSSTIYKGKGDGSRRTVDMTQRVMEVLASRGVNYRVQEARLKRRKVVTDLDPGKTVAKTPSEDALQTADSKGVLVSAVGIEPTT